MATLAFNHFNIRAPRTQLDAVRDFYRDVIGLSEGFRPDFPFYGHWLYLGDLPVLHLMEWGEFDGSVSQANAALDHVAFSCSDLEGTIAHLNKLGVEFGRRDIPLPNGGNITQLNVSDPVGMGVELNFAS